VTRAERLQKLEVYIGEQDAAVGRQIVDKLTSALRLSSLSASEADIVGEFSADLVKKNREIDILENCLKVHNVWRLMRDVKEVPYAHRHGDGRAGEGAFAPSPPLLLFLPMREKNRGKTILFFGQKYFSAKYHVKFGHFVNGKI